MVPANDLHQDFCRGTCARILHLVYVSTFQAAYWSEGAYQSFDHYMRTFSRWRAFTSVV